MRKEQTIVISAEGRDKDRVFRITEMPAFQAERWATRALLALTKSGFDMPDDVAKAGLAGVAAIGLRGLAALNYEDAEPLLEEMLGCISMIPDATKLDVLLPYPLWKTQIEEVATILKLRTEIFTLHTGFTVPGNDSTSASNPGTDQRSNPIKTSRQPSAR